MQQKYSTVRLTDGSGSKLKTFCASSGSRKWHLDNIPVVLLATTCGEKKKTHKKFGVTKMREVT